MGGNPAPQVLHADTVDLPEKAFTKKFSFLPHIPDDTACSCNQQQADKHPDIHAQFQDTHFPRLPLNLHFFPQYNSVLTIAHIQFCDTCLYPFATDRIIQTTVTLQIFISTAVVAGTLEVMLEILVAYCQHIGIKMSHRSGTFYHFMSQRHISFL